MRCVCVRENSVQDRVLNLRFSLMFHSWVIIQARQKSWTSCSGQLIPPTMRPTTMTSAMSMTISNDGRQKIWLILNYRHSSSILFYFSKRRAENHKNTITSSRSETLSKEHEWRWYKVREICSFNLYQRSEFSFSFSHQVNLISFQRNSVAWSNKQ